MLPQRQDVPGDPEIAVMRVPAVTLRATGGVLGNVVRHLKPVGRVWAMLLSVRSVRRWSMRNRHSRSWPLRPMAKH